ncbi:MAG TPA: AraC family transcriptional regulator [Opitutaceae bacterium]|nr:AraC family transcriptional regulator [Opitutaceae bacterium]
MTYESASLAEAERTCQPANSGTGAVIEFPTPEPACQLLPLRETLLIGPTCRESVVSSDRVPQLAAGRFIWVGISEVRPPYRIVRPRTKYSHVVASLHGHGKVLLDGQIVDWRANQVLVSPRGGLHAFEASGPEPWTIAWVFYQDSAGEAAVPGHHTRCIDADCSDFAQVLQLLLKETSGERDEPTIQSLVALLHTHTQRLVGNTNTDQRLARLWHSVEADLMYPWDVENLAKKAFLSAEQLRRLCHRYHRKSPMAHVRDLRMHYASGLLRSSACSVENVAIQAGFASLYSFSAAFKRWSGVSPARFRSSRV